MQFALNRPALQTAGQILNQQSTASAHAARAARNAGQKKPEGAPAPEDLIFGAIADLTHAAARFRSGQMLPDEALGDGLAGAVANIFHLAETQKIDLGTAIASRLQFDVDHPFPF